MLYYRLGHHILRTQGGYYAVLQGFAYYAVGLIEQFALLSLCPSLSGLIRAVVFVSRQLLKATRRLSFVPRIATFFTSSSSIEPRPEPCVGLFSASQAP